MKRKDGIESFMAGFQSVREKEIDQALSYREISELRPDVEPVAFSHGVDDALAGDWFRYKECERIYWGDHVPGME